MSNRVPGPTEGRDNPEQTRSQLQGQKVVEKVGKVGKVDEVDPDQQSRARKFQHALDEAEKQLNQAKGKTSSIYDTDFHQEPRRELKTPLPRENRRLNIPQQEPRERTPEYPQRREVSERPKDPLPRSKDFWEKSDEPPDKPIKKSNLEPAKPTASSGKKEGDSKQGQGKGKSTAAGKSKAFDKEDKKKTTAFDVDASPFQGLGGGSPKPAAPAPEETKASQPKISKSKNLFAVPEETQPPSPPKKGKPEISSPAPQAPAATPKEESKNKPPQKEKTSQAKPETPTVVPSDRKGKDEGKDEGKEEKGGEKDFSSQTPLPPLPPSVQPQAAAALQQMSPFLRPEISSLFYQMVGTINILANTSGVSRTEVVLDSPAFQNSRFFGATILIEKYATAPDSINIRLSGSNEAVAAFRQNIPSLNRAFQNGDFTFRVNRIDAVYSTDRPVFRRKERSDREKGLGGETNQDPRQ